MNIPLHDVLLIGIDGGATEVKTHQVHWLESDQEMPGRFQLAAAAASRTYEPLADFAPIPVAEQFAQRNAGRIELTDRERSQGERWIQAAVEAVVEVSEHAGKRRVLIGIGMPGLKTEDQRGIVVINNGPRIPDYLDQLEQGLASRGIELARPIAGLGSDADYCGLGEMHADGGLLRDVDHAYYAGAGTGIADAMKLRGQLVSFDQGQGLDPEGLAVPVRRRPDLRKAGLGQIAQCRLSPDGAEPRRRIPRIGCGLGNATAQA